jgi:hypothetical protein
MLRTPPKICLGLVAASAGLAADEGRFSAGYVRGGWFNELTSAKLK